MGARGPISQRKTSLSFAAGVPPAPADFDDVARAEYGRMAHEQAATLQQTDYATLIAYARAFSDVERFTKKLRGAEVIDGPQGPVANPLLRFLAQAQRTLTQTSAKLGANPADRSRINATPTKDKANPVAALLAEGRDGAAA
jgi:P27 family predicted phage terminase small subunit